MGGYRRGLGACGISQRYFGGTRVGGDDIAVVYLSIDSMESAQFRVDAYGIYFIKYVASWESS